MPALFFSGMTRAKTVAVYHCGEGRGQYGDFGMFPLHQVEQQQGGFKTRPYASTIRNSSSHCLLRIPPKAITLRRGGSVTRLGRFQSASSPERR